MAQLIITNLFFIISFVHLLFWLTLFSKLITIPRQGFSDSKPKISVIVVFKNEIENLKTLVPLLLAQDYPDFEILLCDDFSSDGSFESAKTFTDSRLKVVKANKDLPGKKFALSEAVGLATGENILVTDADCRPKKSWISSMVKHLDEGDIVLGYSPHLKGKGLLIKFIRFETYMTALQYFSYAIAGIPYMGVGRNMMYGRELFLKSNVFAKTPELISGDDDLFVNAVANRNNTRINLDPESFVSTPSVKSWSSFFKQKRRHVSASVAYKLVHKLLLSVYSFSHIASYLLIFVSIFLGSAGFVLAWFVIMMLLKWAIATITMKKLACPDLIKYFPLLDFMLVCYYLVMAPSTIFKTKSW